MDYERVKGPDGLGIRIPKDQRYRTCGECGKVCTPDTGLSTDGHGVRITYVCPDHRVHSIVDPFQDMR